MSITTAIAIYFLIWWLTLFVVLPWGIRSQHEGGAFAEGTDPGAPVMPRLLARLIWTTLVASTIFAALYVIYTYKLIGLDDLFISLRPPR